MDIIPKSVLNGQEAGVLYTSATGSLIALHIYSTLALEYKKVNNYQINRSFPTFKRLL